MKITKKKPLRPRGRTDEKRQSAKEAIRDAYANGPQREVQIIPAKKDIADTKEPPHKKTSCYHARVPCRFLLHRFVMDRRRRSKRL